ncbi:MAG TPA: nuclear transport factor 2 family protein [Terriglobia bacterium]|nr:nuclear transport factor 2 family protein [Terriglobia bacterium]
MKRLTAISTLALLTFLCPPARSAHPPRIGKLTHPETAIRAVLDAQVADWNRGDVDSFMQSYWKSESTEFVGANGVVKGWQAVLDRYRKAYPDRQAMGTLTFSDLEFTVLCPTAALVTGHYHLQREKDQPTGVFTLVFRQFPEGWKIINDHTSATKE